MIDAKINPKDVLKLKIAMRNLDPKMLFEGEWDPLLNKTVDVVGTYPPDFIGNTYKRTGNLGRNWRGRVNNPLSAQVENLAVYAGYVHGHEQIALHAGHGWKNLYSEGEKLAAEFIKKIAEKVDRIWRR